MDGDAHFSTCGNMYLDYILQCMNPSHLPYLWQGDRLNNLWVKMETLFCGCLSTKVKVAGKIDTSKIELMFMQVLQVRCLHWGCCLERLFVGRRRLLGTINLIRDSASECLLKNHTNAAFQFQTACSYKDSSGWLNHAAPKQIIILTKWGRVLQRNLLTMNDLLGALTMSQRQLTSVLNLVLPIFSHINFTISQELLILTPLNAWMKEKILISVAWPEGARSKLSNRFSLSGPW